MAKPIRLTSDEVATAAQLMGVPPELALAIWRQESSGGANTTTSPKGAVGGFQVMPKTFYAHMPGGDIYNPVDNMQAGLAVLAEGLTKANGDFAKAAQYYYHGKILPPGVEGPTSGNIVGKDGKLYPTPTTRAYGDEVARNAAKIAADRGYAPRTMTASASGSAPTTRADLKLGSLPAASAIDLPPDMQAQLQAAAPDMGVPAMAQQSDPFLDTGPDLPLLPPTGEDDPEDEFGMADLAETDEDPDMLDMPDVAMDDSEDMPGYTGALEAPPPMAMDGDYAAGSEDYALNNYIARLVDEEFAQNG